MNDRNDVKKKSLWYSIIDGCATSVMVGFGESFITAFAIFLKASNGIIGLLSSVPQFAGALAQLISVRIQNRGGNRKSLIVWAVLIQMLAWLPIFFLPYVWRGIGPILLVGAFVVYMAAGNFTVPAWNSMMGDLVDADKRGHYFGKRNGIASVFAFTAMLCGGLTLHLFKPINEWLGFGLIFAIALISRGISAYFLNRMYDPPYIFREKDRFTLWDFVRRSPKSNFGRFVFYIALINLAVTFSGPFFSVYVLRELKFTYAQYTVYLLIPIIVQYLTNKYWGKLCDRFGNKKVLTVTGWLVPIVPVIWLISPNFYWILGFQVFSGLIWGGFNLAASLFIFDVVSPPKRAQCVAYYSLFNSIGTFLGAVLGGWVSIYLPQDFVLLGWHVFLVSSLQLLFVISGFMRLLFNMIFLSGIKEVRQVEQIPTWELVFQITQIKPLMGTIYDIFTGFSKDDDQPKPPPGIKPQP